MSFHFLKQSSSANGKNVLFLWICHLSVKSKLQHLTLVTVPSRLNAPIVHWRLKNLTLPSRVRLKLSTWRLEAVAGLLSTRLATAVYCPLRWRFRTFEMGILAMWMTKNVCYLSGHLFLAELSPRRKCYGIYRRRDRSRSREVCQPSPLFSLLSSGWNWLSL